MQTRAINLKEKLEKIGAQWTPRVVAEMNDDQFKLVKRQGEFVWHEHKATDEVFLVIQGEMQIGFRDRDVTVRAGELFVVPRGVEHITRAKDECHLMLIEPRGVLNTGDAGGPMTKPNDVWV